jgi:hypothetical protein
VEGFVEHYGASVFYCPSCDGYEAKGSRLSAFAALPQGRPRQGLGDPKGLLTTVPTYHVVEGQLTPDQLADCHKPPPGRHLQVTGSGENFTVNGTSGVVGRTSRLSQCEAVAAHWVLILVGRLWVGHPQSRVRWPWTSRPFRRQA